MSERRLNLSTGKLVGIFGILIGAGIFGGSMLGIYLYPIFNPTPPIEPPAQVYIYMEAAQFEFIPDTIIVNEGDHVILEINSTADIEPQYTLHSIIINAFGITEVLPVGQNTTIEFDADMAGTYAFECGIFCGTNHATMVGTLKVLAKGEIPEPTLDPVTILYKAAGSWNNTQLMLIVERESRSILFIEGDTLELVGRITNIGFQPHTAVFANQTDFGYLIGRGGWFIKFSLSTLAVDNYIKVGTSSRGTAITRDDKYVAVSNYDPASFVILNATSLKIIKEFQIPIEYDQVTGEPIESRVAALVDTNNSAGDNLLIAALKELGEVWVVNMSDPNLPIIKIFYDVGEVLHDAFLTEDGRYYMLASQASDWIWVMDVETLTEIAKIPTGAGPHPGPGAVKDDLAYSPSIGEGMLNIYNTTSWTNVTSILHGGPGLFVRAYSRNPSYPFIWWDSFFNESLSDEIYVINHTEVLSGIYNNIITLHPGNGSIHPEFTYDGQYVFVSCWFENKVVVYYAWNLTVATEFTNIGTPTGIFNVGLRREEAGL